MGNDGHDELCYYCGKPCNALAGNPHEWPIPLCHSDEPGVVKWHHIGCVSQRLERLDMIDKSVKEITCDKCLKRDKCFCTPCFPTIVGDGSDIPVT